MNKPDDIPQGVWEIATGIEVMDESVCDWDYNLAIDISKAIMAAKAEERERCAKVAERKFFNGRFGVQGPTSEAIAKAIRDGTES